MGDVVAVGIERRHRKTSEIAAPADRSDGIDVAQRAHRSGTWRRWNCPLPIRVGGPIPLSDATSPNHWIKVRLSAGRQLRRSANGVIAAVTLCAHCVLGQGEYLTRLFGRRTQVSRSRRFYDLNFGPRRAKWDFSDGQFRRRSKVRVL